MRFPSTAECDIQTNNIISLQEVLERVVLPSLIVCWYAKSGQIICNFLFNNSIKVCETFTTSAFTSTNSLIPESRRAPAESCSLDPLFSSARSDGILPRRGGTFVHRQPNISRHQPQYTRTSSCGEGSLWRDYIPQKLQRLVWHNIAEWRRSFISWDAAHP